MLIRTAYPQTGLQIRRDLEAAHGRKVVDFTRTSGLYARYRLVGDLFWRQVMDGQRVSGTH